MAIKITRAADVGFGQKVPKAIPEYVAPPVVAGYVDTSQKTRAIAKGLSDLGAGLGVLVKEHREQAKLTQAREEKSKASVDLIDIQAQLNRGSKAIENDLTLSPKEKFDKRDELQRKNKEEYQSRIPESQRVFYNPLYARSSTNSMVEFSNGLAAQADDRNRADTATIMAQGVTISGEDPSKIETMRSIVHKRVAITPMEAEARVTMLAKYDRDVDLNNLRQRSAETGGALELLDDLKEKDKKGAYKNFKGITIADRESYIEDAEGAAVTDEAMAGSSTVWDKFQPVGDIAPVDRGLMMDELEKIIKDPETLKEARSFLMADINDHNADVAARTKANLSVVFEASDKGMPIIDIRSMQEYVDLPGNEKRAAMSLMRSDKINIGKEVNAKAAADAWFFFSLKTTKELKDMSVIEYHKEWSKMSAGDRGKATTKWDTAHKEGGGEVGVITPATLPSHLWQSWHLGKPSDKKNSEIFSAFYQDYDAEMRAFQASKGRKATIEELKDMASNIMTERILVEIDKWGYNPLVSPTEVKAGEKIVGVRYRRNVPSTLAEGAKTVEKAPIEGARLAPDGNWYIKDPDNPEKWRKVL